MVRYPDSAVVTWLTDSVFTTETGEYVPGTSVSKTIPCRLEPNGDGSSVKKYDGETVVFSYTIFCPKLGYKIPRKAQISILQDDGLVSGEVLRHENYQLISMVWV